MRFYHFIIAAIFGATALLFFGFGAKPVADGQFSAHAELSDETAVIFAWSGSIDPPMARLFADEFGRWKDKTKRVIIELDSPGGSVGEGERVIKVINKMKNTHAVETYVGPQADCLSMCVPIYLKGRLRVAAATSRWMFHEPYAVDKFTGEETFTYDFEQRRSSQDVFYRYFKRSEMNPAWRDKLKKQMRLGDVWKTGEELKRERANVIMVIE